MFPNEQRRLIKIYYVPVGSRFYKQKNVWLSILAGCLTSNKVSAGISKWLKPTKYYVSFPTGVYDPEQLKAHRSLVASEQNFCLSHEGNSIIDSCSLGASFAPDVLDSIIKKYSHDRFNDHEIKMFEVVNNFKNIEIKNHHSIETWSNYIKAIRSPLEKPKLFPKTELNGIGAEDDV
jgi:hypothetical protein